MKLSRTQLKEKGTKSKRKQSSKAKGVKEQNTRVKGEESSQPANVVPHDIPSRVTRKCSRRRRMDRRMSCPTTFDADFHGVERRCNPGREEFRSTRLSHLVLVVLHDICWLCL